MQTGEKALIICIFFASLSGIIPMLWYLYRHKISKFSLQRTEKDAKQIRLKRFSVASILLALLYTPIIFVSCFALNLSIYSVVFITVIVWIFMSTSIIFNCGFFFEKEGIRFGFWIIPYSDFTDVEFRVDRASLQPHLMMITFSKEEKSSSVHLDESFIKKSELRRFIRELKSRGKKVKLSIIHLRRLRDILTGED